MFVGLGDASFSDFNTVLGGEHNIHETNALQFGKHFSGLVAKASLTAQLGEGFPEHVGKETDQDMGLDALGFLVPEGTDAKIALVYVECRLGFGQLDVGAPKFFPAPVGDVAAQQVSAHA